LLAPGNSGRPDSPHYDDQIKGWFAGKYHPMLYRREDVERGARRRLTLAPRA
jgi:penicillin amidase